MHYTVYVQLCSNCSPQVTNITLLELPCCYLSFKKLIYYIWNTLQIYPIYFIHVFFYLNFWLFPYIAIVVRCWCPSSPLRPAPAPGCPPPLPWPQYSCRFWRKVTSAEPKQARFGANTPPGSWKRTVATPAMPSSVGSRVMGPTLKEE